MAFVSSMNYTNEAQFYEAVERAKAAKANRDAIIAENNKNSIPSFQSVLNESASIYADSNHSSLPAASAELDAYFQKAAETYGISKDLIQAVAWQESNYLPNVVSSAGAIGVMQLMPSAISYLGVSDPYNAEQNIMGGAKLLSFLSDRYNGNLELTLAAYNAGYGAVDKYNGIPPYTETQNFVQKIKASLGL